MERNTQHISKKCLNGKAIATALFLIGFSLPVLSQGDGARFYWKGLAGTNAVPIIATSIGGNANPFDPSHSVIPGANVEASMSMVGYAKFIPFFKRSAMVSVIAPMGRLSSDVTAGAITYKSTSRGFGDPMLQFTVNVVGPKAITSLPDMLRYKPGFSVDVFGSLAVPIGEYDSNSTINIGQNRWYGRLGVPIICQLGPWIPGRRTTIEVVPLTMLFGENSDFAGKTMQTDPMLQIEAHLTHDFMDQFWGSFDIVSLNGGKTTVDGTEGNSLSNLSMGGTLGFVVNDNMQLNLSYTTTVNDNDAEDLKMDGFRFTLLYGWHPIIEGVKRLKSQGH